MESSSFGTPISALMSCMRLRKNQLKVTVTREEEDDRLSGEKTIFWVLREAITGNNSVIRVATGWKHLRTAFWSAFRPDLHIP